MEQMARNFALMAHGSQKYGSQPYSVHLEAVHANLVRWNASTKARAVGFLHDVLEDTEVSRGLLAHEFGEGTAALAEAVSKRRGESLAAYFERVRWNGSEAVLVKLADRLANVTASRAPGSERYLQRYREEAPLFVKSLMRPGEFEGPWAELLEALES
jgi:(p)ppGpp synthase/HD superfamily hydrolase